MKSRIIKGAAIICLAATLASCSLIPFEDPEEQRRRLEEEATRVEVSLPSAFDALTGDRAYKQQLKNQADRLLAVYDAKLPTFDTQVTNGSAFESINEYYDGVMEECRVDCEAFFQTVKKQYGVEWDMQTVVEGAYRVTYSYEILPTQGTYICIDKVYNYITDKGREDPRHYPDVFLAENGWRLSFDGLFGQSSAEASRVVMEQIRLWCQQNQVAAEKLDGLAAEAFTEYYAMDEDNLIFYSDPFELSTNDGTGYQIKIPLEAFDGLFVEN